MPKLTITKVVLLVFTAFAVFILYSVGSLFIPRHGEATRVSDLRRPFSKAGPAIEAIFTNSLIQKFPFDGPIAWRLVLFKEPMLSISGRADTNALRAFVSAHPGTQFMWTGTDAAGGNWLADEWPTTEEYPSVDWKTMKFGTPHTSQFSPVIDGALDIVSNRVRFLIY